MIENLQSALDPKVQESLDKLAMDHRVFCCNPELADTAAFCEAYGFALSQAANAIITATKSEPVKFACCVVLATTKLDVNKKVSVLLGTKKVSFANAEQTLALTGMQIGGVTPFGLPEIPVYVDAAVLACDEIVLGGGNRSTKVLMRPEELRKLPGVEFIDGLGVPKII